MILCKYLYINQIRLFHAALKIMQVLIFVIDNSKDYHVSIEIKLKKKYNCKSFIIVEHVTEHEVL